MSVTDKPKNSLESKNKAVPCFFYDHTLLRQIALTKPLHKVLVPFPWHDNIYNCSELIAKGDGKIETVSNGKKCVFNVKAA